MMENQLITIEEIEGHDVTFLKIREHVCAYVRLDTKKLESILEYDLGYETFREGSVVGIDTAHYFNMDMTFNEKLEDAKKQISVLIKDYNRRLENDRNNSN